MTAAVPWIPRLTRSHDMRPARTGGRAECRDLGPQNTATCPPPAAPRSSRQGLWFFRLAAAYVPPYPLAYPMGERSPIGTRHEAYHSFFRVPPELTKSGRAELFFHSPLPLVFVVPFISRGRRAASSPASKLHALKKKAPALIRLVLLPLLLR
ncbi:hypothetical protein BHE74_00038299 [Ensete ventricosum]|nr:hypothetical protein BHE74_00038299 [Ensete ventricosum]